MHIVAGEMSRQPTNIWPAGLLIFSLSKLQIPSLILQTTKSLRWSEASFLNFGGTLFFDVFIPCVVKIHEKMTYLTFVSIVKMFHFGDF